MNTRTEELLRQIDESRAIFEEWDETILLEEGLIISDEDGYIPAWQSTNEDEAPKGTYIQLVPDAASAQKIHQHFKKLGLNAVRPDALHMTLLETPREHEQGESNIGYTVPPEHTTVRGHVRRGLIFLGIDNPAINNRRHMWMNRMKLTSTSEIGKPHVTVARHHFEMDPAGKPKIPPVHAIDFPIRFVKENVLKSNRM